MASMEEQILKAAESLFMERGYNMTSTVEIARKVGCNQALVHYYFRTKENLFIMVFMKKIQAFISAFTYIDTSDDDFFTRLSKRIDKHFDEIAKTPNLPFFVVNDLALNRERRLLLREQIVKDPHYISLFRQFDSELKAEIEKGRIRPITTIDLLLNIMSLDAMAFLSEPVVRDLAGIVPFPNENFIEHRREEIKRTIRASLMP